MSGLLSYPRTTASSLAATFGLGTLLAIGHTFGALLPATLLRHSAAELLPSSAITGAPYGHRTSGAGDGAPSAPSLTLQGQILLGLCLWAYPVLSSGVRTVLGFGLAHDHVPGVAVADWPAVAQLASLVGLWGIGFLLDLAASAAFLTATDEPEDAADDGMGPYGGRTISLMSVQTLSNTWQRRLRRPLRRHVAAAALLLLAAAAVGGGLVHRGTFYQRPLTELLARQQRLAASCVVGQGVLPGSEAYLWLWQKTAERVAAGPARLPLAPSPYGLLAGGICFDLDRPQYIRAAGAAGADLLLQPSWTWGDVGPRHFAANSLRAIENGLTILRCSSSGVSGVIGPRGTAMHALPTGEREVMTMELLLEPHLPTAFARGGGWALEWANLAAAALLWGLAALPRSVLEGWLRGGRRQAGEWDEEEDTEPGSGCGAAAEAAPLLRPPAGRG
ncbi:hypothetical protein GPECTOR_269g695 [Gonium pectorale]|uniref:CN hydrolase domain-containing protein n=1 Tax=Gonium pectorale TaxID=33097 RepID=A0A150FXS2_GONPE|nr:hypothetical protein GPECTOR_269g695 [Gonium pectorale]|eukprot:KXZ41830.1 hypothetical protein GPECTOR_269g695 [Gonium pectorale]